MSGMKPEEAIEILSLARFTGSSASELDAISEALDVAFEALKEARPRGEWVILPYSKASMNAYKCSICGHVIFCSPSHLEIYKGCYCGADMRKEGEAE